MVLRRRHRIVGRCSLACRQAKLQPGTKCQSEQRLPLMLSLEEVTALILRSVIRHVVKHRSVLDASVGPVSSDQRERYASELEENKRVQIRLNTQKKKLNQTAYYGQIVAGLKHRTPAKKAKSDSDNESLSIDSILADREAPKVNDKPPQDFILHQPRATPTSWFRPNERTVLDVPCCDSPNSLARVVTWLQNLATSSDQSDHALRRCIVFDQLLRTNDTCFLTCAAAKMGGDFLMYEDDPLFCHATHIVFVIPAENANPDVPTEFTLDKNQICSRARIANKVRKVLVLANVHLPSHSVSFTSLFWSGSDLQS
ncbi:hypothetical protein Ciccas_005387 [Cichlidogyrus casuarinus]|uniref:tRNA-intron lyase n=1 Tax=Cichlidogyrus casuarinus TaxID=1844966 RepID=A0ABD2Q8W8_9PLAT